MNRIAQMAGKDPFAKDAAVLPLEMAVKNGFANDAAVMLPKAAGKDLFAKEGKIAARLHGAQERFCENQAGRTFAKPFFDAR